MSMSDACMPTSRCNGCLIIMVEERSAARFPCRDKGGPFCGVGTRATGMVVEGNHKATSSLYTEQQHFSQPGTTSQ